MERKEWEIAGLGVGENANNGSVAGEDTYMQRGVQLVVCEDTHHGNSNTATNDIYHQILKELKKAVVERKNMK